MEKDPANSTPDPECSRSQEQMTAINEQLRQHELTAAADKVNAQLRAEIAGRKETEEKMCASELETKSARDYAEAILRAAPVPFLVLRPDLRVDTASEAFYKTFKLTPVATEGLRVYEIGNHSWDMPELRRLLEEIIPRDNWFNGFEVTHEFESIGRRTMLLNARRVNAVEGVPERILLAIDDITERKEAEEAMRERARLGSLRADIGAALVGGEALPVVLQQCTEAMVRHLDAAFARIWTLDEAGQVLELKASAGLYTHLDGPHGRVPVGAFKIGRIAANAQPLLTNDVPHDENISDPVWARRKSMVAFAGYPMMIEGRVLGVMAMFARHAFSKAVLDELASIADGIAQWHRRKSAEDALREGESRKSAILDCALDAIITMDHEGNVVDFNPAAESIFGRRREEMIGQRMAEKIIPERLRERHHQGLAHYLVSGEGPVLKNRIEVPALHSDGHEFMIELSINRIAGVEPAMFTATLRDITERQRAEAALRESEARFRTMADNIAQLAWMADAEGGIFWYNQRWFDYTGTALGEMQGWGWQAVNHPDHLPRIMEKWQESLAAGTDFEDTFPLCGADGEYRWFLTRAVPIRDESGNVQRWFGTNTDVTEQRAVADALTRSKSQIEAASRAKDDFLAALSHELRTPLTPVLMIAADLAGDPSLAPEVREQLAMLLRNAELEARLIDDLLDITRISNGKLTIAPVAADLHLLLQHTAEIIRSDGLSKQVRLVFILEAAKHHVFADPTRLQQVFWNLLKNALKFTPTGGTITVSTRNDADGCIVVSVADTGIGIGPDALPNVFTAFEQGPVAGQHRYGGLGLGLAISRAIVAIHGGTIGVESDGPGLGATFTVTLAPVAPPTEAALARSPPLAPGRALRLLLIEDDEATVTVLSRILKRSGHAVTTAGTVLDARTAYAAQPFDVVISDLGLPDGSGLDLMRELQRQRPVPAIALSGYGMDKDLRETKQAGFFAHLVKPVMLGQLRLLLDQIAPPKA